MSYPSNIWKQIKNITKARMIDALVDDGFHIDEKIRTERIYRHPDGRRVSIHYHKGNETFGPSLLKGILKDIGWNGKDLRRLKLIK